MILLVDIGSTNIVVGLLDKINIINSTRVATDKRKTDMDFLNQIKLMLSIFKVHENEIEGSMLSNVVPELTNQLFNALKMLTEKKHMLLDFELKQN